MSRTAPKEQAHFLDIAYGSLMETDCQLDISLDLGYISREMREMLDVEINSIGKMIRSLKQQRTNCQWPPPNTNSSSPIADHQKLTDICVSQKKVVTLRADNN